MFQQIHRKMPGEAHFQGPFCRSGLWPRGLEEGGAEKGTRQLRRSSPPTPSSVVTGPQTGQRKESPVSSLSLGSGETVTRPGPRFPLRVLGSHEVTH